MIETLFLLLVGHAVADFALQTDVMAKYKSRYQPPPRLGFPPWYYWMGAHSLIHGGAVYLVTGSLLLGIAETGYHWVIDFFKCEGKYSIHVDQGLHVACKLLWVLLLPIVEGL